MKDGIGFLKKQSGAEALLLITTAIWGSTFVVIKVLLTGQSETSPFVLLTIRFAVAAFLALIVFRPKRFPSRSELVGGLIIGIAAFAGYAFQTIGLVYTTPAKSGFITSLFVLFIPFISIIWERKRIPAGIFIALIPAVFGLWAISGVANSIREINIGDKITLLSALSYAFQIVGIQIYTSKSDWKWLTIIQFATIAIGSAIGMMFERPRMFSTHMSSLLGLLYLSVIASVGALGMQMYAQRFTTSARASFIYIAEPIFATLFAWLTLGQGMRGMEVVGAAAIVVSITMAHIHMYATKK